MALLGRHGRGPGELSLEHMGGLQSGDVGVPNPNLSHLTYRGAPAGFHRARSKCSPAS